MARMTSARAGEINLLLQTELDPVTLLAVAREINLEMKRSRAAELNHLTQLVKVRDHYTMIRSAFVAKWGRDYTNPEMGAEIDARIAEADAYDVVTAP